MDRVVIFCLFLIFIFKVLCTVHIHKMLIKRCHYLLFHTKQRWNSHENGVSIVDVLYKTREEVTFGGLLNLNMFLFDECSCPIKSNVVSCLTILVCCLIKLPFSITITLVNMLSSASLTPLF